MFIGDSVVYFYTDEVELPHTLSGDVVIIPLVEVTKPNIKDIATIDSEIKTTGYDTFKWAIDQGRIIYPAIYGYVKRAVGEPKSYVARYSQYVSPSKLTTNTPEERARKVKVVTGTVQDCIPEHNIAERLHEEIDKYAKENNIPDKEKAAAIARARKMNVSQAIRRMCYLGILNTPYYGTVTDKGRVYEEYLVRPAGIYATVGEKSAPA
jgi:hypothetical protein